ncbi:MAG: hypothetical protein ACRBF0_22930 [Calditrichia bacterium]
MLRFIMFLFMTASGPLLFSCSGDHENSDYDAAEHHTEEDHHGHDTESIVRPETLQLPENLAAVLRMEMIEISNNMGPLLDHLSRGNSAEAASIADKIQNSFILKQQLSSDELKELVSLLPTDFVTLDRAFHGDAGKLAGAVRKNDFTSAAALYSKMAVACVACHGKYATNRFPGLLPH